MFKKLRFQEDRAGKRHRVGEPHGKWVLEAIDIAMVAVIVAIMIWLQWLLQSTPA